MKNQRQRRLCGAPGQPRPAIVALYWPKVSAREPHQRNVGWILSLSGGLRPCHPTQTGKPSTPPSGSIKGAGRFLRSQLRRLGLGHPPRARPRAGRQQDTIGFECSRSKPELSTLLGTGTFYFALTSTRSLIDTVSRACYVRLVVHCRFVRPARPYVARGNPVQIRNCPAAVIGNDHRQKALARSRAGKRRSVGCDSGNHSPAHESEDLPATRAEARGKYGKRLQLARERCGWPNR